jgi:hypothetical protein
MDKISKLQIVEPKFWSGLTREAHLGWMGLTEPELISKVIDKVYEVNYGADNIVSFIEDLPVHYLDTEGPYQWLLQGSDERNIPLVKASLTASYVALVGTDRPGLARTPFYMWFPERYFEATSVIVGQNPDNYSLRIVEDPVLDGGYSRAKVELITGDDTLFVPVADLAAGIRWSEEYALVEQELSKRGNGVHHAGFYRMENTTSYIRKQYDVPGNMIIQGKNKPLAFAFLDGNGKQQVRWIDKLGWDFMVQFRRDKARLIMNGKSNKLADGSYGNKGESGNTIKSGFGLIEQMEGGHILYYNDFSADLIADFALDLSIGKLPEDKRVFVLSTGERGLVQFHQSMATKANTITYMDSAGFHLKSAGDGKVAFSEGQFVEYQFLNGIKFKVTLDPMKDDPIRNKLRHPDGGLASSYIYDIWDAGTTNGESNIMRVAVKDNEEFFRYIPGMRDPFTPGGAGKNSSPTMTVSPVDGYTVMKMYIGGVMIKNPLRTGRILPSIFR